MSNASFRSLVPEPNLPIRLGTEAVDNFIGDLFSSETAVRFPPGNFIEETQAIGNNILVGSGNHQGFILSKPHTLIHGEQGAIIDRIATIKHHAVVSNLHFKQTDDSSNENHLVRLVPHASATVASPIRVLFRQCIFERKYNASVETGGASTKAFVVVDPSARAIFTGCVFRSDLESGAMNGVGIVVQNLNALATTVYVTSGVNLTTHAHNNVTVIGPEI